MPAGLAYEGAEQAWSNSDAELATQVAQRKTLTALDVLVGERLAKFFGRRRHGAAQQQPQARQEHLPEVAAALLELVGRQVRQLRLQQVCDMCIYRSETLRSVDASAWQLCCCSHSPCHQPLAFRPAAPASPAAWRRRSGTPAPAVARWPARSPDTCGVGASAIMILHIGPACKVVAKGWFASAATMREETLQARGMADPHRRCSSCSRKRRSWLTPMRARSPLSSGRPMRVCMTQRQSEHRHHACRQLQNYFPLQARASLTC